MNRFAHFVLFYCKKFCQVSIDTLDGEREKKTRGGNNDHDMKHTQIKKK